MNWRKSPVALSSLSLSGFGFPGCRLDELGLEDVVLLLLLSGACSGDGVARFWSTDLQSACLLPPLLLLPLLLLSYPSFGSAASGSDEDLDGDGDKYDNVVHPNPIHAPAIASRSSGLGLLPLLLLFLLLLGLFSIRRLRSWRRATALLRFEEPSPSRACVVAVGLVRVCAGGGLSGVMVGSSSSVVVGLSLSASASGAEGGRRTGLLGWRYCNRGVGGGPKETSSQIFSSGSLLLLFVGGDAALVSVCGSWFSLTFEGYNGTVLKLLSVDVATGSMVLFWLSGVAGRAMLNRCRCRLGSFCGLLW